MPSESVENYLKAIYKLERGEGWVANRDIAERLKVSPPSVSRMVKRLGEMSWVEHHPYHGVRLTDSGRERALRVTRNHRILETYLAQVLGMGWDEVDAEVERLEHAVSEQLINRLEEALGFPKLDPHGSPIPDRHGVLPQGDGSVSLLDLSPGAKGRITRIADAAAAALAYLGERGLIPGTPIELVAKEPFEGPIHLRVSGESVHLGNDLARRVQVLPSKE